MYLSIEQFKELEAIKNNMVNNKTEKSDIEKFDSVLLSVLGKHQRENKKTALYIAEKRKADKNYARENKRREKNN